MFIRALIFFFGLLMLSTGISVITHAGLGTGTISSVALVLSKALPLSMGFFVFLTNVFFFVLQTAVDPSRFLVKLVKQIPICFVFGLFFDAAYALTSFVAPARHFIETSQYRLVYELMREWFELRPVEAEKLVSRLASVTSPRLYEYFSLVSLLGGLERRGWTSVEAKRHEYAGAGPLYADNAAAALLNTFIFRRKEDDGGNEEIVRLWYQPVLAAGNVEPENGIGLARTTRWSVRPLNAEAADTLRETDRAWYSPDFLISLESGGRTAWAVMDSKYSTVGTVLRHHAMQQAFKYLTSLGTVRKDDVYAGLWLYCGSVANDRTQEGSFFNASAPDVLPVPDMVLERVNALSEADPVAGVLERLRTVLAR